MTDKIKVGVLMGGMSTEHDVSLVSGTSVIKHLDKEKYDIFPIYIDKEGKWFKYTKSINEIDVIKIGEELLEIERIDNIPNYLKKLDLVFPVLHGLYGEDGTIQGLLELLKVKYIGSKVLGSSISMDKAYTKALLKTAKIPQAEYIYVKKEKNNRYICIDENFDEVVYEIEKICEFAEKKLGYPIFVKPSNSGSSVGINKANNKEELIKNIKYAEKFDNKILLEECIIGRELECAVLERDGIIASGVGEIIPSDDFYTFDAKYKDTGSKIVVPAQIEKEITEKIKEIAIKVFKTVDSKGLARIDFFIRNNDNQILVNEINTMPGFTNISMYPMLWGQEGIKYNELLDILIENEMMDK